MAWHRVEWPTSEFGIAVGEYYRRGDNDEGDNRMCEVTEITKGRVSYTEITHWCNCWPFYGERHSTTPERFTEMYPVGVLVES